MLLWSLHHTPYSDIHALYVLCPIIHHHRGVSFTNYNDSLDTGIETGKNYVIFFSQNGRNTNKFSQHFLTIFTSAGIKYIAI